MSNTSKLNFRIKLLYILTIPTFILSLTSIIVGIISIWKSAPYFKLPFCAGGAMIAGITTSICGAWYIRFYRKFVDNGREHMESADYDLWSRKSFFIWGFVLIGCLIGLVAGIWGVVYVRYAYNSTAPPPTDSSFDFKEYGIQNEATATATLTLSLLLTAFMMFFRCYDASYEFDYKEDRRDYFNFYTRGGNWIHLSDRYLSPLHRTFISSNNSNSSGFEYNQRTSNTTSTDQNDLRQTGATLLTARPINGTSEQLRHSRINDVNDREISYITGRNEMRRDLRNPRTARRDSNNTHNSNIRLQRFETPPPKYEEVCETHPPTYNEVNLVALYV